MIERTRPERPPYVPRWILPALIVLFVLALAGVAIFVVTGIRDRVETPDVVGLDEGVARVRLAQAGLTMEVGERPFDASEPGTVLNQIPAAGSQLSRGEPVVLVVSEGTEEFAMPDVIGLSVRIARAQLETRGITIKVESVESDAPSDTVIATNPSPGATLRTTDIVRLSVATAPDASDALLPYALNGATFVIDPTLVQGVSPDVTMEVARRLRSLLEASGGTVSVTRSATGASPVPAPGATDTDPTVSAFIGLDVLESGTGGMAVSTLSATDSGALYGPSYALADAAEEELRSAGNIVARETVSDATLKAAGGPAFRVRLGSADSPSDSSSFSDPAWADKIARALYRAIGERVGSR